MKKLLLLFICLAISFSAFSKIIIKHIPDRMVVLTFDDAMASQYSVVAPLLKEFGFGALFSFANFRQTLPISPQG